MNCRKEAELIIRERGYKCEIAGSLRRGIESAHDVDIVCANPDVPPNTMQIQRFTAGDCNYDIYHAHPDHFGPMMLTYTGPSGANIGMRVQAKKKSMKLNQYGLFDQDGRRLDNNTEDDICQKVLGRNCKPPEER